MFQNAFFDRIHTEMIPVEHLLGILQVEIILGKFAPGQIEHCFHIIELGGVIGCMGAHTFEFFQLLVECLCHLLRPFFCFGPVPEVFDFLLGRVFTEFILNGFHLLLQEVFALLLINSLFGFVLDGQFDFEQLRFFVE